MLKKTTAILLTMLLIGSLVGCSQSTKDNSASVVSEQSLILSGDTTTESASGAENPFSSQQENDTSSTAPAESGRNANGFNPDGTSNGTSDNGNANGFKKNRGNRMTDENGNFTQPQMPTDENGNANGNMTPPQMPTDDNGNFTPPQMPTDENGNFTRPDMPTDGNFNGNNNAGSTTAAKATADTLDASDLFSKRDLEQTADTTDAKTIQAANGKTETITEAGVYVLSGTAQNFTVRIEADKEAKVQLVLDGLNVTNENFPVIYVVSADKVFVTTTNSENNLSVTGTFTADGDTNTDAVIFSKDDIVFNGTGSLTITSAQGNGISGKDDIKFTGGTYNITSKLDSVEANDSIAVYAGNFTINSSKDAFHSEDGDDDTTGYVYMLDGTFNIKASSDSIQATTLVQIDGGTFTLTSSEGIEATYVRINGGTINITASDDGINAAYKSRSYTTPTIEINDGNLTIVMGQGDTDAIDANGNIVVNGGTINITAQMSSFDYDGTAQYNGGTIIINGQQVDSIPQSMMGGRGGMGGGMRGRF